MPNLHATVNLEIFARDLFSLNFADAGFRGNKTLLNGENSLSFIDVGKSCQTWDFLTWKICLNAFCENKTLMKIPEFTVFKCIARMLNRIMHIEGRLLI